MSEITFEIVLAQNNSMASTALRPRLRILCGRANAWRARTSALPKMDVWRDRFDDDAYHWVVLFHNPGRTTVAVAAA
ncbi:hypothetical protein [Blastomonas sp. AAP53]|uniref:hypothetical protein n=1 Tax=Blastomonas sp. AAP53 TaxID=1248760 RepID=UPI0012675FD9|nr:hypothetical protein [Blastomonas sp. AAP53]